MPLASRNRTPEACPITCPTKRQNVPLPSKTIQISRVMIRKAVRKRSFGGSQRNHKDKPTGNDNNGASESDGVWEDVPLDFKEPPITLIDLPLELRDNIWDYVLDDLPAQVALPGSFPPGSLAYWLHTDKDGQFTTQNDPKNLQLTFFTKIFPDQIYANKQIFHEASLVFLRRTHFVVTHDDSMILMHQYLSSFPDQQGYRNLRYFTKGGECLDNWGCGPLSPHSLVDRCPGVREIVISVDFAQLIACPLRDIPLDGLSPPPLLSPYQFEQKTKLAKICTLQGPLKIKLLLLWNETWVGAGPSAKEVYPLYIAALESKIDRCGTNITLEWSI